MAATTASAASTTTATSTAGGTIAPGTTAGVEAYEDMFKEITRKLYGEETGHGLHGTPIAQVVPHSTGNHLPLPEGERSFTTLISDRAGNSLDLGNDNNHLFGLAALMQNGFTQAPSSILQSTAQKTASPNLINEDVSRWSNNVGADNDLLHWNVSQPMLGNKSIGSKNVKKEGESKRGSQGSNAGNNDSNGGQGSKRYTCSNCPYSTDRRDLYTRHENIHKAEKPFHCYVCLKQFNRADHVKKHFLRMHREMHYDINKTRRTVQSRGTSVTASSTPANVATEYYVQRLPNDGQLNHYNAPSNVNPGPCLPPNISLVELPVSGHNQQPLGSPVMPAMPTHPIRNDGGVKVKRENTCTGAVPIVSMSPPGKKKSDKRFSCGFCPWIGADNWGLKRHLNTHTKPYVCTLCDYKAARSERLVTHVYKVHNKKACNKCSFMADDHAQFLLHQNEAHPVDGRRGSNDSSVLRTIGNTTNNTASGNGGVGSVVTQNMDIFGNEFTTSPMQGWRPTPAAVTQKRGAERLFQYMEAEGSDPEDYQKQLHMTALSRSARNTVAQDFHNAGGGARTPTKQEQGADPKEIAKSLFANKGYQQTFIRDLEEFIVERLISGDDQEAAHVDRNKSYSSINTPPPAKRRRCNSHDKENQRQQNGEKAQKPKADVATTWSTDRVKINARMRDIFQMMAQHYGNQLQLQKDDVGADFGPEARATESLGELERILKNNHELTISIKDKASSCIKYSNGDSGLDDEEEDEDSGRQSQGGSLQQDGAKSKRKSFCPRKIDSEPRNNLAIWNSIRDKHLSRLMSHKKSCLVCAQRQSVFNLPHQHSVSSLILHKKIRHWSPLQECRQCRLKFKHAYQLQLHWKLKHTL